QHDDHRLGDLCARQPRHEAAQEAQWSRRANHARARPNVGRDRRPSRRGSPGIFAVAGEFLDKLVSHYVLDDGKLVVAHAGMKERYVGRASGRVREFALYGETTGETDE